MHYLATVEITLRTSILDPQGKATANALAQLGFEGVEDVRIGKLVELRLQAPSRQAAEEMAADACKRLLANSVMEDFSIRIEELEVA